MGLFKPKGKHAQGAHAQSQVVAPNKTKEQQPEINSNEVAETAEEAAVLETVEVEETSAVAESESSVSEQPETTEGVQAADTIAAPISPEMSGFAPATSEGVAPRGQRHVGKVIGIAAASALGVLLLAYLAGALVFMNWFFPHTIVAGKDVSMKSSGEVVELLNDVADNYTLDVVGNGFNYETTSKDVDLSIDADAVVKDMHSKLNVWAWPAILAQDEHDVSDAITVKYNDEKYAKEVKEAVDEYNKTAVAPVDATISYDEKSKKFKIVEEVPGTQYNSELIVKAMDEAVSELDSKIKLNSSFLIQPKVFSTDTRLVDAAELATGLISAHVTLTMGGQVAAEIDGTSLSSFIRMDENLGVTLDEAGIDQWITDLSNGFDTVGTERTYTRPDGKVITVSGGAYGWETDALALKDQIVAAVKSGQTTTIDIPCEQTGFAYNGAGKQDWGNRYIDVDLSEQYVRMYGDDGSIIWESACISGTPDGQHNTWPGVWYITNKEAPSKLIGYLPSGQKEYETTVAFWMAFEGNGIGLHDATWQPAFGGDMYASGYGSHGCVNLPYDAAAELYGITNVGDVVVAHF